MADTPRTGSCNCGAVRYTIAPCAEKAVVCHCTSCQKQSASAFGAVIVVPSEAVTLDAGTLSRWTRRADSGNAVECHFCTDCGTRIWHGDKDREPTLKVRAGTLDSPIDFSRAAQIWTSSKAPGITIPDGVPAFEKGPA